MSSEKFPKKNTFSFVECWERIRSKTIIENYSQLAEIVRTSKSNVTKRKEEDNFPIEWAFLVAQKNNLTTEWILTGVENREEITKGYELLIKEWVDLMSEGQGRNWFANQFETAFPLFKKWKEGKEEKKEEDSNPNRFPSSMAG
jgi:hypothetical protein